MEIISSWGSRSDAVNVQTSNFRLKDGLSFAVAFSFQDDTGYFMPMLSIWGEAPSDNRVVGDPVVGDLPFAKVVPFTLGDLMVMFEGMALDLPALFKKLVDLRDTDHLSYQLECLMGHMLAPVLSLRVTLEERRRGEFRLHAIMEYGRHRVEGWFDLTDELRECVESDLLVKCEA